MLFRSLNVIGIDAKQHFYDILKGHSDPETKRKGIGRGFIEIFEREAKQLPQIKVPTLTIGGTFDTMDPEYMKWMSTQVQNGRFLLCPNGSHMSMYDDQKNYFPGLIKFIHEVDKGNFKGDKSK